MQDGQYSKIVKELTVILLKEKDVVSLVKSYDKERFFVSLIILNFYHFYGIPIISDAQDDELRITYQAKYEQLQENFDYTISLLTREDKEYLLVQYSQHRQEINPIEFNIDNDAVELPFFMPSLKKFHLRVPDEVKKLQVWMKQYQNIFSGIKLDGVSALLHIQKDSYKLYTRGDGQNGRDITYLFNYLNLNAQNVQRVQGLLESGESVGFRGEIVIRKDVFLNKYKNLFASPR